MFSAVSCSAKLNNKKNPHVGGSRQGPLAIGLFIHLIPKSLFVREGDWVPFALAAVKRQARADAALDGRS
jgi:hypothetical protein